MNKIETLFKQVLNVKKQTKAKLELIKAKLQLELDKKYAKSKPLQQLIELVNQSKEYGSDECGIYQWVRASLVKDIPPEEQEYFEEYLGQRGLSVDFKNEAIFSYLGGCFVINTDEGGDIYDTETGKLIIEHNQYETRQQAVGLLKDYMNKHGYYPGVFSMDRYGYIKSVRIDI